MKINFKSEVFSKLYKMAERQDTSIPVLVNKIIEIVLNEEEKNAKNGTTFKSKNS